MWRPLCWYLRWLSEAKCGKMLFISEFMTWISSLTSGFHKIIHMGGDDEIHQFFHDLFPSPSTNEQHEHMLVLTKAYHNYKSKYVRHLSFNPKGEYLGKAISKINSFQVIGFSHHSGACSAEGSVHLLWHSYIWWDWEGCEGNVLKAFTFCVYY